MHALTEKGRLLAARLAGPLARYRLVLCATALALACLFGASLWLLGKVIVDELNDRRLQALADTAVTRMERNIDLAVISMGRLVEENHFACTVLDRKAIRDAANATSSVRDIRLQSANDTCWGLTSSEASFGQAVDSARPTQARNGAYGLAALKPPGWRGLMVKWEGGGWNMLAVLGTSGLLFDLLPNELRDHAAITMAIEGGASFADHKPDEGEGPELENARHYRAGSDRYPISVALLVDKATLSSWNHDYHYGIDIAAAVFALAFGALAARGLLRPPSALDDLDHALAEGEIVPFYQPLFALDDRRVIGFEMLARWIRPDGSMIPPSQFIPLAEREGRIDALTDALLTRAGKEVGALLHNGAGLKMTFNVTPDQLIAPGFAARLSARIASAGLPARKLVVEITERQAIADIDAATAAARLLVEHGFRIAIDDAGTGHNGLSSLHALSAHYLKIDKYFVDGVALDRKSSVLIEMMVSLATELDMTVVAEGIESPLQIDRLLELGIREGQGFVFSRPITAEALKKLIAEPQSRGPVPARIKKLQHRITA